MGRPRQAEVMETVSARLPRETLQRVDEYLEHMRADAPLLLLNRADAVRALITLGLRAAEKQKRKR